MTIQYRSMIRSTLAFAAASFMFVNAMPAAAADAGDDSFSFAVLGDTPNNPTFTEKFPQQVQEMNRDSSLEFVAHVVISRTDHSGATGPTSSRFAIASTSSPPPWCSPRATMIGRTATVTPMAGTTPWRG
ncbi:hypothetical protein [Kocuria atrinae]|uniref:hypothetical protein n=1 Tax=Kocuria atrinae TaxID=592377 RepID=UPI0003029F31|nr:hypothetical protein [Kocuria atrinae]